MTRTKEFALRAQAFMPLRTGEIRPAGWLGHVLRTQADGLTGHLDEFWPDVADSGWLGGKGEGWERAPYWLDGLIPLAWQLDDPNLQDKAHRWIDTILDRQQPDGWFGDTRDRLVGESRPVRAGGSRFNAFEYDPWPRFVLLKVLLQYREITGDERILPAVGRFLRRLTEVMEAAPLRSWGRYRWADLLVSLFRYYELTDEEWVLELALLAKRQGFDWIHHATNFPFYDKVTPSECDLSSHGPNNAMGIKAAAIASKLPGELLDDRDVYRLMDVLDRFHGQATGMFSCDEHLAGRSPIQGSELCAVVEYMYSLEVMMAIVGAPLLADRIESLAFNALPATISPDMWTHQYDQQVNQAQCVISDDRVYTSNGPDANLFGLEPHFGCCTANMHQGYPKYTTHLWMRTPDNGLAAISYAPCQVITEIDGHPVLIEVSGNYPWADDVSIRVHAPEADLPISLRIPGWAQDARVSTDGEDRTAASGTFETLTVPGGDPVVIRLTLGMRIRVDSRSEGSAAVYRGPLLYALPIDARWVKVVDREPVSDWELHAESGWNYAIDVSTPVIAESQSVSVMLHGATIRITPIVASLHREEDWDIDRGAAAPLPGAPVTVITAPESTRLMPYGLTSLRIAEFPLAVLATPVAEH